MCRLLTRGEVSREMAAKVYKILDNAKGGGREKDCDATYIYNVRMLYKHNWHVGMAFLRFFSACARARLVPSRPVRAPSRSVLSRVRFFSSYDKSDYCPSWRGRPCAQPRPTSAMMGIAHIIRRKKHTRLARLPVWLPVRAVPSPAVPCSAEKKTKNAMPTCQ